MTAESSSLRPYRLSNQIKGHQSDVRALASHTTPVGSNLLISASRDKTACVWARLAGKREFEAPEALEGHGGYVNSCAWISDATGNLFALTGGQDKLVNAYEVRVTSDGGAITSHSPDYTLLGHEDNVSALDVGPAGSYIVSGSWDKTARVWKGWNCVAILKGHLQAVWAVLAVDDDRVITASADKMIRLWSISSPKEPKAVFTGHGDAVRGLRLLPGGESFASCSNDGTVNVYDLRNPKTSGGNQPIRSHSGHTSFVYSLAALPGGELISSGEDRSMRVWDRSGQLRQTITIPAISVWTVVALEDGDLACGSSDSFIRIFTRDPTRHADASEIEAFDRTVASQALNKTQVGDLRKDQVPGKEALSQPGTSEGQTKMVSNGDVIEAYQWSTASSQWEKVGEVVGGVGSGQKKLYEGREYDYVFDVDISDDMPPLKLPYNLSDNAYLAAQRFLERYELPLSYIDQVLAFIDKNTEAVSIGAGTAAVNPLVETGRYIPGSASAAQDTAAQSSKAETMSVLPVKSYLSFKQANVEALQSKLLENNAQQGPESKIDASKTLSQLSAALSSGPAAEPIDMVSVQAALSSWPPAHQLPMLDLARLAALFPINIEVNELVMLVLAASHWKAPWPEAGSADVKLRETNAMLAARTIANTFTSGSAAGAALGQNAHRLLSGPLRVPHFNKLNKNGRVAYATILLNFSILLQGVQGAGAWSGALLDAIVQVLTEEDSDEEVVYRGLVALGNIFVAPSEARKILAVGNVTLAKDVAQAWGERLSGSARIKDVLADIAIASKSM